MQEQSIWTPTSGAHDGGYADAWGNEPRPNPIQLGGAYRSTVAALVDLIATKEAELFGSVLLAANVEGQTKHPTQTLSFKTLAVVPQRFARKGRPQRLTDHPVIELLNHPNKTMSQAELIRATFSYLGLCGNAYWLIVNGEMTKTPKELLLLASPYVTRRTNEEGEVVYRYGSGEGKVDYKPEQIIHFKCFSPFDPYHNRDSFSPAESVWLELQLEFKSMSTWDALIVNAADPRVVIAPKDDVMGFTEVQTERLEKKWWERYQGAGNGGPLVSEGAIDVTPLTWPAKDLSALQLDDALYKKLCRAFKVPTNYFDELGSRWAIDAAEASLRQNCIKPGMEVFIDTLNHRLLPLYDERLFYMLDDVEIRDQQVELQQTTAYLQAGVVTVNEVRAELGKAPVPWGDKPLNVGGPSLPGTVALSLAQSMLDEKKKSVAVSSPLADELRMMFEQQRTDVLAGLHAHKSAKSGEAAIERKAVPTGRWWNLDTVTQRFVPRLLPVVEFFFTDAMDAMVGRAGLSSAVPMVVQQGFPAAVESLVLNFCQSTNDSTDQRLDAALSQTRQAILEGVDGGEAANQLGLRVNEIFDGLSTTQAYSIAATEESRARHQAELMTLKDSGLNVRKKWLARFNACPECLALADAEVGLEEPFYVNPRGGPYAEVLHPPRHPGACTCSLEYLFED